MTRKNFWLTLGTVAIFVSGCGTMPHTGSHSQALVAWERPVAALLALEQANAGFADGRTKALREQLAAHGQKPFATVLTCSDSRVPPELLFGASLGDLFVIRTAGNVVGAFEAGSVEYGAEHLGTPVVLVLGHTQCGAVAAALKPEVPGGALGALVRAVKPAVEAAKTQTGDPAAVAPLAEVLNVRRAIETLRESPVLRHLEAEGKTQIVGALYDMDTGLVRRLDGTPLSSPDAP